jgi:hypothetical protein
MITGIRHLEKTLLMTMQRRYQYGTHHNSMANTQPRFETVSTFMFDLS